MTNTHSSLFELTPQFINEIKEKADIVGEKPDTTYLDSPLRPPYDDSDRIYLKKLKRTIFDDLGIDQSVTDVDGLRRLQSDEILSFKSSEELVNEEEEEETREKRTDPRYKKIVKNLEKYKNRTFKFDIPRPVPPAPMPIKSYQPIEDVMVGYCQTGPRGVVNVFKSCAVQVKQSSLQVGNVAISKTCDPVGDLQGCTQTMQIDINKNNCKSLTKNVKPEDDLLPPLFQELQRYNAVLSKVSVNQRKNKCQTYVDTNFIPKELEQVLGLYESNIPKDLEVAESLNTVNDSKEGSLENLVNFADIFDREKCLGDSSNHTIYNCEVNKKKITVLTGKLDPVKEVDERTELVKSIFYCKNCKKYKNREEFNTGPLKVNVSNKKSENVQCPLHSLLECLEKEESRNIHPSLIQLFPSRSSCNSVDSCKVASKNKFSLHNPSLHQFCKSVISSINKLSDKLPLK